MSIRRIIISYEDCDKSLDDIILSIAPDIIKQNRERNWVDDNYDDIMFAITTKYDITGDDFFELQNKVNKYLNK